MFMQVPDAYSPSLGRLVADAITSHDIDYLENDYNNLVINEDVNLNKAHWNYDYQPMELCRDEGENRVNLSEWMTKPVIKWSVTDTLAWVLTVAKENNLDFMGDDTNMYAFSEMKGYELNQLTIDDFFSIIPKREFAMQLHERLMKLKQNYDPYGLQSQDYLESYTSASQQVPMISVSSSYDSGDNASLYPLQEDLERNDSGYEDPSDSELQLPMLPLLGQQMSQQCSGNEESDGGCDEWSNNTHSNAHAHATACSPTYSLGTREGEGEGEPSSEEEDEPPKKRPGRPRGIRKKKPEKLGRLWEFIRDLLSDSRYCPSIICWDDYEKGTFRFVQSEKVARLWGEKKENPDMNFEKFSRAMRYYYKSQVLIAVQRRLVYQFGPKAMIRQKQALQNSNNFQTGFPS